MIRGERVRQAREAQGLTQLELAKKVGVEQPFLSLIEQNARQPSEDVLSRIALATRFPKAFFRLPPGPDFPLGSLLYRGARKLTAQEQSIIRQYARLALELVSSFEGKFKPLPVRVPSSNDSDHREAAALARSALGYSPDGPVTSLMGRLEKAGVLVYAIPVEASTTDAFSAWAGSDGRRPVVVLTRKQPGDRQRFTLAHELGHLVMHQSFLADRDLEEEANAFAAEFLIPEEEAREELSAEPITITRLAKLKSRWGVSLEALLYRAQALNIITPRQHGYIRRKMANQGFLKSEPVPIDPERPKYARQVLEATAGSQGRTISAAFPLSSRFIDQFLEANGSLAAHTQASETPVTPAVLAFKR